jgi:predicted alpha/beta-hydrolase family hydrolase
MDFDYRKAGRRAPDKAPVAMAAVAREAGRLLERAAVAPDRLVLGGRSYGGRMGSMAVAEGLPAAGLVLLSYPLHPPGQPERLRSAHFPQIRVPCLFLSGRSDPFGTPEEFERALSLLPGPVTLVWLKGGHDPTRQDALIVAAVKEWLGTLV